MNRVLLAGLLGLALFTFAACSPLLESFTALLTGSAEVPPVATSGSGNAGLTIDGQTGRWTLNAQNLSSNVTMAHIHGPAAPGVNAGILVTLAGAQTTNSITTSGTFTEADIAGGMTFQTFLTHLRNGMLYVNVHTTTNPSGEVRGQLQ